MIKMFLQLVIVPWLFQGAGPWWSEGYVVSWGQIFFAAASTCGKWVRVPLYNTKEKKNIN